MIENNGNHIRTVEWYKSLDDGIRFAVRVLHAKGINTGQSCEGGQGHAYEHPTVDLWGYPNPNDMAGFAALHALAEYDIPVRSVSFEWSIRGGGPFESFWRIELMSPLFGRKDDLPTFAWRYTAYMEYHDSAD